MNKLTKFLVGFGILFAVVMALVVTVDHRDRNDVQVVKEEKSSLGACSGTECTEYTRYNGGLHGSFFSEGGGVITVATTAATYTLTQAELMSGNQIYISPGQAAALSLTLPATSTLTKLLPKAGDVRNWEIRNGHTAAATTTTILVGTGIELQGDSSGSDVINGGVWGALRCNREANTDVTCVVHEYVAAD